MIMSISIFFIIDNLKKKQIVINNNKILNILTDKF